MKKAFAILLVIMMLCSLAACGAGNEEGGEAAGTQQAAETNATEAADNTQQAAETPQADATPQAENTEAAVPELGEPKTYGNITVAVPEGWVVIPGGVGGKADDNSLFIKESETAEQYIWVNITTESNITGNMQVDDSREVAPFTVNGVEWQGKERAFYADMNGLLYFVRLSPAYSCESEGVQMILASLADNAK